VDRTKRLRTGAATRRGCPGIYHVCLFPEGMQRTGPRHSVALPLPLPRVSSCRFPGAAGWAPRAACRITRSLWFLFPVNRFSMRGELHVPDWVLFPSSCRKASHVRRQGASTQRTSLTRLPDATSWAGLGLGWLLVLPSC